MLYLIPLLLMLECFCMKMPHLIPIVLYLPSLPSWTIPIWSNYPQWLHFHFVNNSILRFERKHWESSPPKTFHKIKKFSYLIYGHISPLATLIHMCRMAKCLPSQKFIECSTRIINVYSFFSYKILTVMSLVPQLSDYKKEIQKWVLSWI